MNNSRRIKRMARAKKHQSSLSLTSLMDVFTILVFFLLVNQSAVEVVEPPKEIKLPASQVESRPRPTVIVLVSEQMIMVQGEPVATMAEVAAAKGERIPSIIEKLTHIRRGALRINTATSEKNDEITILAHKTIPFKILQKLMTTCAISGYTKISLAVVQKSSQ